MSSVRTIFRSLNILTKNFCSNAKKAITERTTSELHHKEPTKLLESKKTEVVYPQPVTVTPELLKRFGKPVDKKKMKEYLDDLEEAHRTISPY